MTRFRRLIGEKTRFLTGTDEHGQNIEKAAAAQGITPIALADRVVARYQRALPTFEIQNDDFIRTTEKRHQPGVEALIARIAAAGDFYTAKHEGWYCSSCEAFYTEKELDADKTCPVHGTPDASGNPRRTSSSGSRSTRRRCSSTTRSIPGSCGRRAGSPRSSRSSGAASTDLSVSRTKVKWGIPFPGHPGHVVYVWLDALANYITALGFGGRRRPRSTASSGTTRRPSASTSSARTSCASTPCTGRRFSSRPACRCRRGLGARLVAARREEDLQVGRQHRAARPARRGLRPRRAALLPAARDGLRPGRQLLRRGVPDALQRRSRQRPRQHGVARGRALPPVLRRHAQRGLHRQRDPAAPTRRPASRVARRHGATASSTARSRRSGSS